jgi:hypothetical protein
MVRTDLRLVVGEERVLRHDLGEDPVPLLAVQHDGGGGEGLPGHLHRDVRVRDEVVVPVRMSGRAGVGGDHEQPVGRRNEHHRCRAHDPAAGTDRGEQQQRTTVGSATVGPEVLDDLAVVCLHIVRKSHHNLLRSRIPNDLGR